MVEGGEILEVLARGELPVQAAAVGQHGAHLPSHLARLVHDVQPQDAGCAGGRFEERGEHPHRRGLSCAVRTEQAKDLTALDPQVDAVDRPEARSRIGLAPQALPQRAASLGELLDEPGRLDRRGRHAWVSMLAGSRQTKPSATVARMMAVAIQKRSVTEPRSTSAPLAASESGARPTDASITRLITRPM